MPTIYIDNVPYEVPSGTNLLQACLSLGFNLPYFCWHPAMHSVGACRQCAVKQFRDENDTRGRIVMACMTPATEGTRISISDPEAVAFRAGVIEWLMVNHPHDCPVCDEGGNCHLQDMTLMTGHNYRRYRFRKRTYLNQYLGPLINHEMNRCIQCYRCVRYYRDYAGGHDLQVFGTHDRVYFGRHEEGVLENEFSGNLVEICPTGVFTDGTLKQHYTRKWDFQTAPSVCVHCGLGCNTIPGERYGELRRIRNRFNLEVNFYFLCDRGRFGYEFVNAERRLRYPFFRAPAEAEQPMTPARKDEALARLGAMLANAKGIIGLGSPRASLEANFALRALVGAERFYHGVSDRQAHLVGRIAQLMQATRAHLASLADVRHADAALVLGEDVTNYAPLLALALRQTVRQAPMKRVMETMKIPAWDDGALRQAIQDENGPLYIATVTATKLDEVATGTYRAAPDDLARFGFAVAEALGVPGETLRELPRETARLAQDAAEALLAADNPLIVGGPGLGNEALLEAAALVADTLAARGKNAEIVFTVPECNSLGLALMGGQGGIEAALAALRAGQADTLVVLENDLYRHAEAATVDALLSAAGQVIVLDSLVNDTVDRASAVLPAATYAESDGTFVNNEGRAQRFYQVFVPAGEVQESWRWLRDLMAAAGRAEEAPWANLDEIIAAMAAALPVLAPVAEVAPPATFRIANAKLPRQTRRFSGRTAITANISVHERRPPDDPDSPFSFSMEGADVQPPAPLVQRPWHPGWNSHEAWNKFQDEVGGPLRGGPSGKRLIVPQAPATPPQPQVPPAFAPRRDEWLIVPLYHIFGSEDLSLYTPGVAELAPKPYLALGPADAQRLGLRDGEQREITLGGQRHNLLIKVLPEMAEGLAGLPFGLPGLRGPQLPAWSSISAGPEAR